MSTGTYDTWQNCVNGHSIDYRAATSPQHNQNRCNRCGAETITACPQCPATIRGKYQVPGIVSADGELIPPTYCHNCGQPYPWTAQAIAAAKELADLVDGLSDAEIEQFRSSIDDLVQGGPESRQLHCGSRSSSRAPVPPWRTPSARSWSTCSRRPPRSPSSAGRSQPAVPLSSRCSGQARHGVVAKHAFAKSLPCPPMPPSSLSGLTRAAASCRAAPGDFGHEHELREWLDDAVARVRGERPATDLVNINAVTYWLTAIRDSAGRPGFEDEAATLAESASGLSRDARAPRWE